MAQQPPRPRRKARRTITHGQAHIRASFNNTIITIDRALVRVHGARQNIDADELGSGSGCDCECAEPVVPQHVHTGRKTDGCDFRDGTGHGSDRHFGSVIREERCIAEVLDHDPFEAGCSDRPCVNAGTIKDGVHRTAVAGGSRERLEVDHADEAGERHR